MTDPLHPRVKQALDAFTVPDLPADFADRMVALAAGEGEAAPAIAPEAAPAPRRRLRLWLGGMAIAGAGFASFSAAAMGYFGEPLRNVIHRVPIVHRLVERLAPRHRHPFVAPAAAPAAPAVAIPSSAVTPAAVMPAAPAPAIPATQSRPAGLGLRRAAAAAAIWQARHPDAALPRRFTLPPGAVRAARPDAEATGQPLRILRERRAARALGAGVMAVPAPASPPLVAPPAPPVVQATPTRVERPAAAATRPWRWWEQEQGPQQQLARWRRRQTEGGSPPATAPVPAASPAASAPAGVRPESQPNAGEAPRARQAEPHARAPRPPRMPHPRGGGRRRF